MDVRRTQRGVEAGEAGGEGDDDAVQHVCAPAQELRCARPGKKGGVSKNKPPTTLVKQITANWRAWCADEY